MKDIKGKSKKELLKLLNEKRGSLQSFKYELAGGKSKNTKNGRNLRREIAQIMTELTIVMKSEDAAPAVKTARVVKDAGIKPVNAVKTVKAKAAKK